MKVYSTKGRCYKVAERWKEQYFERQGNKWYKHPDNPNKAENIWKALLALGPTPEAKDINQVIHGCSEDKGGWTSIHCDECQFAMNAVVSFDINGDEYEYKLCACCLREALELLENDQN